MVFACAVSGESYILHSYFLCQGPNIPLLPPHALQVSSNSYNHTVFGRMVKKKLPPIWKPQENIKILGQGKLANPPIITG